MAQVLITPAAQKEFEALPLPIQARVLEVFERLAEWPAVSGWKALRGDWKGAFRIRTGDYRVVFTYDQPTDTVTVVKIGDRRDVYLS
jgi:mRNA interferase RelE/StbE